MKDIVFRLLFKDSNYIDVLPFERKYLVTELRKRLTIIISYMYLFECDHKVKTKNGEIDIDEYIRRFTKSLFHCLIGHWKYKKGIFDPDSDIPNKLYHGTSTEFLSNITKDGLLPSEAGQFWKEDKDKKPPKVCLTDSMYAAEFYADNAARKIGGQQVVVIFNIRRMRDKMNFMFEIFRDTPSTTFDIHKEIYFNEPVPPDKITDWYFVPEVSARLVLKDLRHHYGQDT